MHKHLMWLPPTALGLVLLIVGVFGAATKDNDQSPQPDATAPLPKVTAPVSIDPKSSITLPNTDSNGQPLPQPTYDAEPTSSAAQLVVPLVDEPCTIEKDGIGAPADYTKACLYTNEQGGQAILSHSVRGPRSGVFDRIDKLPLGTKVTISGVTYEVKRIDIYPADAIPNFVWTKGSLSLITCTLTAQNANDPSKPWTHTTVVSLG